MTQPLKRKPLRRTSRNAKSWTDMSLPLLVCLLSGLGSWTGIMLSAKYSTNAYQNQKTFDWEARVLDRRIEIMERMTRLIAKQPRMKDEWENYLVARLSRQASSPRMSSETLSDYTVEYTSTVMLAKLYFGDKTTKAIDALGEVKSPWWQKPKDQQLAVISAMTEELMEALPAFSSIISKK